MVCHWSRMRPVFSRSGRAAVVSVRSAGISGAMKRALKSLAKNPPSAKKRACGSLPCRTGHCTGAIASKSLSDSDCSAPMSKSRAPLVLECRERGVFAKNIRRRVEAERRTETEPLGHLAHDPPIGPGLARRRQETRAAARCAAPNWSRCRISRPRPAPAAAHARRRRPCRWRSTFSETTNSSSFFSASRAASAFGSDTAGLVPITHSALISPRAMASNIWTAFSPSWVAMRGAFQNRRTRSISGGVNPIWAASWLASPPTSRPPIALGCPVSENGDAPGLADPPGREVAIDDGVDLVGALRRLVDALRIQRDHARRIGKHLEERRDVLLGQAGRQRGGRRRCRRCCARARCASSKPVVWRSM